MLWSTLLGNYSCSAPEEMFGNAHKLSLVFGLGWKDVDDYYQNSGSHLAIPNVRIPLLCIQAADDPIAVSRSIPREAIRNNPNCVLVVTPSGGHLGWIAGEGAPFSAPWTDLASMEWIKSVLEHLGDGENKASLGVISEKNLVGKAL